jgi:hypothetical protein
MAVALPRDRQSSASSAPNPGTSPGDCDKPSQVPSGIVKLILPASARPPGKLGASLDSSEPGALLDGSKELTGWPVSSAMKT